MARNESLEPGERTEPGGAAVAEALTDEELESGHPTETEAAIAGATEHGRDNAAADDTTEVVDDEGTTAVGGGRSGTPTAKRQAGKPGRPGKKKLGFFGRIALFFRQVIAELKKVVTPTGRELVNYTIIVLVFVLFMMALIFGLDALFGWLAKIVFAG